ncbi:MAG: hypothetical protein QXX20_08015 [Candidatus Thermoplasmatota archaeon]
MVFIVCILACSGCLQRVRSYIPNQFLVDGWYENTGLQNTGLQLFGFEQWVSVTYEVHGRFPALLTITTVKTLLLANEEQLFIKTKQNLEQTFTCAIRILNQTEGQRFNAQAHHTYFVVYTGIHLKTNESVRIIGEVWNCGVTGSSIICVGIAHLTNANYPQQQNLDQWQMLVADPQGTIDGFNGSTGLIYNVCCH